MRDGFIKVGAVSPKLYLADVRKNCEECVAEAMRAEANGVKILVFPELSLCGSTCQDIFTHRALTEQCERELTVYINKTRDLELLSFVGVPVALGDRIYNCSAAVYRGMLLGLCTKTYINHKESRYFSASPKNNIDIEYAGFKTKLGGKLLFRCSSMPKTVIGCEIGSEYAVNISPASRHSEAGANLIVNPTATVHTVDGAMNRRTLITAQTARSEIAYLSADASTGESGTDGVYAGHSLIASGGKVLAERMPFGEDSLLCAVVDIDKIISDRRKKSVGSSFTDNSEYEYIDFQIKQENTDISGLISRNPFVPEDEQERVRRCHTILDIQAHALADRMTRSYSKKLVIGISGGLDSTLALLVCIKAVDLLGLPRESVVTVTMPCFGTTKRTKGNADKLCELFGTDYRCVNIKDSVTQHLTDIGHDLTTTDVTYENAQARERTQVLMDIANSTGGLVVGTGDLSELVLGWATYNGDHMSMYAVNGSVPKTLVRRIVEVYAEDMRDAGEVKIADVLCDVLSTPVSPELLPPKNDGEIAQCTEDIVGPYELHDFFIFHTLRHGYTPRKLMRLAVSAFSGIYDEKVILGWMRVFFRRFFNQQFKRSCLPDGPMIGSVSVSPRGELIMPSDADSAVWMRMIEDLEKEYI